MRGDIQRLIVVLFPQCCCPRTNADRHHGICSCVTWSNGLHTRVRPPSPAPSPHSLSTHTCCRDSIGAQLQLALAKADSEQLARSIAEEQLSDVEKEKTMLELELKEALARHRDEVSKKDILVTTVSELLPGSVARERGKGW